MERRRSVDEILNLGKLKRHDDAMDHRLSQSQYFETSHHQSSSSFKKRISTNISNCSHICKVEENTVSKHEVKQYGIGITGFDRITNSNYQSKGKAVWIICFLIFGIASLYQSYNCFDEFYYGMPAITVDFLERQILSFPTAIFCPLEFFGNNPGTESLKKKYRMHFNMTSHTPIIFSDLLLLPGMDIYKLWSHQEWNCKVIFQVRLILL